MFKLHDTPWWKDIATIFKRKRTYMEQRENRNFFWKTIKRGLDRSPGGNDGVAIVLLKKGA